MESTASDQFTIGLSLHRSGRIDDAVYFYNKALEKDPKLPEALINLGAVYLEQNKYDKAEPILKNALKIKPNDPKILSNLGNLYQNQKRFDEAEEIYLEAIEIDPDISTTLCNLGSLYLKLNKLEDAIITLQKAININPKLIEAHLALGAVLIKFKRYDEAEKSLRVAITLDKNHAEAYLHLGLILYFKGLYKKAEDKFRIAVNLKPNWVNGIIELAKSIERQNRKEDAETYYKAAIRLEPKSIASLTAYGFFKINNGEYFEAKKLFDKAENIDPKDINIQMGIGQILSGQSKFKDAEERFKKVIEIDPNNIDADLHIGISLQNQKEHYKAISHFEKIIKKFGESAETYNNIGNSYSEKGIFEKAYDNYKSAIKLAPKLSVTYINLGNLLRNHAKFNEALKYFKKAININPKDPRSFNGIGLVYQSLNKEELAIDAYKKAYDLEPDYPEALNNLAVSLQNLGKYYEAISIYKKLIDKHPEKSQIYFNLGTLLQLYGRHDESVIAFRKALEKDPKNNLVYPFFAHALMQQCNWENLEAVVSKVIENTNNELEKEQVPSVSPFGLQCMPASKTIKKRTAICTSERAQRFVSSKKDLIKKRNYINPKNKLKIGFISPDFRRHSVAIAFKGVLEARDKNNFEYHAYSISTYGKDNITEDFKKEFDKFTDITYLSHEDAAKIILSDEINILIDLAGHTRGCRYEIFALRPAPIQAHWLGFSSTTGAKFIDYLITDKVQNPLEEEQFITEKIVHLPHTFMATSIPNVSKKQFNRKSQNLPEEAFVFTNFNSHYKFYPSMFSIWMRLLKIIPNSVLWLLEGSISSRKNLILEAEKRGVSKEKLIFAKSLPHDEHLSRLSLADLSLDNQFHGGGVTSTDTLWAGVPLITLFGDSPPSRNGATILTALEVPELITYSLREYEEKALYFSQNINELKKLKQKILEKRYTAPLFDNSKLAKNLEKSFIKMWDLYNQKKKPEHIIVK